MAVSSAQAFEEPVIQEFDRLPDRLGRFVSRHGRSLRRRGLRQMVPRLQSVRIISLHNMQVTNDCFEILATFRHLKEVEFVNCPQLAKDDFMQFHKNRPDVRLFVQNPDVNLQFDPKKH